MCSRTSSHRSDGSGRNAPTGIDLLLRADIREDRRRTGLGVGAGPVVVVVAVDVVVVPVVGPVVLATVAVETGGGVLCGGRRSGWIVASSRTRQAAGTGRRIGLPVSPRRHGLPGSKAR